MKENRPVIKLQLSFWDKVVETAGWVVLVLLWLITIFSWFNLPEVIPTHFNAAGVVDGHGSKGALLVLPVIGTFLFGLITLLIPYPHIFNYLVKITNENAERQYILATRMMRYLKLGILLIFLAISVSTFIVGMGKVSGLGVWFLPVMLSLIFLPTIYLVVKSFRSR